MSYPVYSTRFLVGELSSGFDSYTVPNGSVAVLQNLDCLNNSAGAVTIDLLCVPVATGASIFFWTGSPPSRTSMQWKGKQVLNAGDRVAIGTNADIFYMLSGFLLSLP